MITAIIQARMGSSRLPGKVMMDVAGQPLLGHMLDRLEKSQTLDEIVLATSVHDADNAIAVFAESRGIRCYRGSEDDVLDRFHRAARWVAADVVVRLTADCPLIEASVVDELVHTLVDGSLDIVNTGPTFPEGLDGEVMTAVALDRAWREADLASEREHVTAYLWKRCPDLKTATLVHTPDLSDLRIVVDEPEDLEVVRTIFERLGRPGALFGLAEILALREREPALLAKNADIIRNEGYAISLAADREVGARPLTVARRIDRSTRLWTRAEAVVPGGSQTISKGPSQYVRGVAPVFLERGSGSHTWDIDGNEYIDYVLGLGAVTLGFSHATTDAAVEAQLKYGTSFSLINPIEIEVAETLRDIIPCAEMVRFGKNGSDVTAGAVRLARAFTGRERIACCGYHGWQDWYIGTTTRNKGVPGSTQALTHTWPFNDAESLDRLLASHPGEFAAVILEAIAIEEPAPGFLEAVNEVAHRHGALVIYDEIVNGFRIALGGAQEYFGVIPDLATFGKGMANGMPLAALVGREDVMRELEEVFFSFTFGGEALSLAAARSVISEYRHLDVVGRITRLGGRLKTGYRELVDRHGMGDVTGIIGLDAHSAITFAQVGEWDPLLVKSLFQQELLKRGILSIGVHNVCYDHTDEDVDHTLAAYDEALQVLAEAVRAGDLPQRLEGEPITPVFKRW